MDPLENAQTRLSNVISFLFVTFDFPPNIGGISTRVANYSEKLSKMGRKALIVHLMDLPTWRYLHQHSPKNQQVFLDTYNGSTVIRCAYSPRHALRVFFAAIKAAGRFSPNAIHVFSGNDTPIGLLFLLYGRLKRSSTGVSIFGMDLLRSKRSPTRRLFLGLSLFLAERIGANSKATMALIPGWLRGNVGILYPGIDTRIPQRFGLTAQGKIAAESVLFVGRLVWRKGIHDLLHAFKILSRRRPRARLAIVGGGPRKESLEELAANLGILDRIQFAGTLSGSKLYQQYFECDVFVMPSRQSRVDVEGFGIVFLEAGLFGKPCVGTRTGGIPEAVLDRRTGILVEQGDVEALADAIGLLLSDRALAAKLGQCARHRILAEFSSEKAASRLLTLHKR